VRIPLDYYRILGLPLAASDEQLRQAYSDRIVQLPRREYSTAAISSRKELIEEAYEVLSDPQERSAYNQIYLAHAYSPDRAANLTGDNQADNNHREPDPQSLSIEITPDLFVGSLLILQELGEYELVLKLGRPYIVNKPSSVAVKSGYNLPTEDYSENSELPDIILTVALACLELGREQWQQGHYENAAVSLETGAELLVREGLFLNLQGEISADLYKLRPYRILELLAQPLENTAERRQGLQLLQTILEDRSGIDGTGNDQSGLNIDDFLRFMQQLRFYLTVAEQHKLFESESKRPSPVATYLAVYALIARGFAQRQPALIRQAKQMLMRLGKRQDVHLEQSLCALLLGQTEEATRVLELSHEYEALAFIREKSLESPDLLPGLCLYAEQWLQQEVFPHFRDLSKQKASLKDYFAQRQVQAYLESLPTDAETTNEWTVVNRQQSFTQPQSQHHQNGTGSIHQLNQPQPQPPETTTRGRVDYSHLHTLKSNTADRYTANGRQTPARPVVHLSEEAHVAKRTQYNTNGTGKVAAPSSSPPRQRRQPVASPNYEQVMERRQRPVRRRRTLARSLEGKMRLILTLFTALAAVLILWFLISTTVGWVKNAIAPPPDLQGPQLAIELNQPVLSLPDPSIEVKPVDDSLTNETAEKIIQTWLSTKGTALGPNHEISSLEKILTGPVLLQWQSVVEKEQAEQRYRQYSHELKIESVDKNPADKERAVVKAKVKEVTQYFEKGLKKNTSQENLLVQYELIRKDNSWRIKTMSVVNKIGNP
jgi:hypothetical protein